MLRTYHCSKCGGETSSTTGLGYEFMTDCKLRITQPCPLCGGQLVSGFKPERYFNPEHGSGEYGTTHWSEAMAIGTSQIEAHKKLFQDIPVRPDGVIGFNSVQQQENYMTSCGFVKHTQKLRPIATR